MRKHVPPNRASWKLALLGPVNLEKAEHADEEREDGKRRRRQDRVCDSVCLFLAIGKRRSVGEVRRLFAGLRRACFDLPGRRQGLRFPGCIRLVASLDFTKTN